MAANDGCASITRILAGRALLAACGHVGVVQGPARTVIQLALSMEKPEGPDKRTGVGSLRGLWSSKERVTRVGAPLTEDGTRLSKTT